MSTDLPQSVQDAIHQLATYASQCDYAEVIVSRAGSAHFKRSRSTKRPVVGKYSGWVAVIAAVWVLVVFLASLAILGLSAFAGSPKLDIGWVLILVGAPWLLAVVVFSSAFEQKEWRTISSALAIFTTFVFGGLALLSEFTALSMLFYAMGISCFVLGTGLDMFQSGLEKLQAIIRSRKAIPPK